VAALIFLSTCAQHSGADSSVKKKGRYVASNHRLHVFTGTEQVDIFDIINYVFTKNKDVRKDTSKTKVGRVYTSVLPYVEYTLQTGFAGAINGNLAFYTSNHEQANISNILAVAKYTTKKQFILPIQANIWSKGNKFNFLTDWHFEKFPQQTYGLGSLTTESEGYLIDYSYIRLYQTLLKTIFTDFYLGFGYDLDYYFNIVEVNPPAGVVTDFEKYGLKPTAVSSGVTLNLLYDERRNAINPQQGYYANIIYRTNYTFLGSDTSWAALQFDLRKYQRFPNSSSNILAFWTYDWFTLKGKPPYLNLPSTASDTYNNFGRGYIQGRFRGRNLLYLETEYRFGITTNGFIGGVVFANAQSFSEETTGRFEAILPGCGGGIRIKLNKFSKTNLAIDYGLGLHGSKGIFANLGEVF
jgi:Omp85 superfamily domain